MNKIKKKNLKNKFLSNKYKFIFIFVFLLLFTISSGYALYTRTFNLSGNASIAIKSKCEYDITGDFELVNSWGGSEIAKINITNNSEETIDGFDIEMKLPKGAILTINGVNEAENGQVVVPDSGIVTLTSISNDPGWDWQSKIRPGNWSIQFQINYVEISESNKLYPEWISFNGCTIFGEISNEDKELKSLSIVPNEITIGTGSSADLALQKSPARAEAVIAWSSSNQTIVTVDNNGKITGVAPGTATITASSGNISAISTITVKDIEIQSITVSPSSYRMTTGEIVSLIATKNPSNASGTITWTSSDTNVATVTDSGRVTAMSVGTATITASIGNVSASATITVIDTSNISEVDVEFNITNSWESSSGNFNVKLTNNSDSTINKVMFDVMFPEGTTYTLWWSAATNNGNSLTFEFPISSGNSIEWGGFVSLPAGYNISNYMTPRVYNIRTE